MSRSRQVTQIHSKQGLLLLYPKDPVLPSGIELSQKTATGAVGVTKQITATVTPDDTDYKNVTWSSSNDTVATVDTNGLVTFVKEGTATITAETANGLTATVAVTVTGAE